jgi:ketosteroid isomerase-like protein
MSQENMELVRAVFKAWNARDLDILRELYDPGTTRKSSRSWGCRVEQLTHESF